MIVPVELALPCRLVRLELRVGPEQGATTLEDLVARGILAAGDRPADAGGVHRRTTIAYLAGLFVVPERVVVDVVSSLWTKGYVTVDLENGRIELSDTALARLSRHESLAADGDQESREFLFEPITGMIHPEREGLPRANEGSVRLPLRHRIRTADIPQDELVRSVQSALRRERLRGGRKNVLQVSFGNPALPQSVKVRWLHVRVAAHRDPQSDRISVTVDDSLMWSSRAQQQLRDHLDRLADDEPDHPVVHQLKGRARTELEPAQRLDDLLRRMADRIAELDQVDPTQVAERHRVLGNLARRIQDRLVGMREARAVVTLVSSREGHAWALLDLIDAARSQLVLVAPDLDYTRTKDLLPGLRRALDRGVQLVAMWGRASSDSLSGRVETLLDELEVRPGARIIRASRSTQTEACVVIQDDSRAIVGSHAMLASHVPGAGEASVLIEPARSGPARPRAVTELLRWARTEFPRWSLGQRIELHPR